MDNITPGEASLHAHWLYDQFVHQEFEKIRQPVNHYMDTHMDDWRASDNVIDDRPTHGPGQYDLSSGSSTTFSNIHEDFKDKNGKPARLWNDADGVVPDYRKVGPDVWSTPEDAQPTVLEQRTKPTTFEKNQSGLGIFN